MILPKIMWAFLDIQVMATSKNYPKMTIYK